VAQQQGMTFRSAAQTIPQDWQVVQAWLIRSGLELSLDQTPRQFAGGLANLNYLVTVNGAPAVLRRPPPGPLAHGASDMAREAQVLQQLPAVYPLAPKLLHFCPDVSVIGAPFQLLEYRTGLSIGSTVTGALAAVPQLGMRVTDSLFQAMTMLHAVQPGSAGLDGLGRPHGFLARQVAGWRKRAMSVFEDHMPHVCSRICDYLAARIPEDAPAGLLHCDFKPDNMLFDPETLAPVAVLDWDMCTLGPPLFDLGVLLAYWIEPGDPAALQSLGQVPSLLPGWPTRQQLAQRYFAQSTRTPQDVSFYLLLGRLRLAIAWMQLYRMYELGHLIDPSYATFYSLALSILDHAWENRFDPVI
jgi:aminoglycoside phosphotransferase (APT) family kinase protein